MPDNLSCSDVPLDDVDEESLASSLKALGHPVRLRIVKQLMAQSNCCCGDLCACFPHTQSTISQHLSILREAGIIGSKKKANRTHYFLCPANFKSIQKFVQTVPGLVE